MGETNPETGKEWRERTLLAHRQIGTSFRKPLHPLHAHATPLVLLRGAETQSHLRPLFHDLRMPRTEKPRSHKRKKVGRSIINFASLTCKRCAMEKEVSKAVLAC